MKGYTKDPITGEYLLGPLLKLIGAKTKIRHRLYPYFPEHQAFYDVFMGTCGITIGKKPCEIEVAADVNEYAINFYQMVQQHPEELYDSIMSEWGILEWHEAEAKYHFEGIRYWVTRCKDNPIVRAAYFYIVTRLAMNGIWRLNKAGECNSSFCKTIRGRGLLTKELLYKVRDRILNVRFICQDYKATLSMAEYMAMDPRGIDRSILPPIKTFCFIDPPYHSVKTTYNGIKFTDEDFKEMAAILEKANYMWLMTINDNAFIRETFKGYEMVEHSVHYSCSQTPEGRSYRPELLIANYSLKGSGAQTFN